MFASSSASARRYRRRPRTGSLLDGLLAEGGRPTPYDDDVSRDHLSPSRWLTDRFRMPLDGEAGSPCVTIASSVNGEAT